MFLFGEPKLVLQNLLQHLLKDCFPRTLKAYLCFRNTLACSEPSKLSFNFVSGLFQLCVEIVRVGRTVPGKQLHVFLVGKEGKHWQPPPVLWVWQGHNPAPELIMDIIKTACSLGSVCLCNPGWPLALPGLALVTAPGEGSKHLSLVSGGMRC